VTHVTGFAVQSHEKPVYADTENRLRTAGRQGSGRTPDDDHADLLVRMWSLATGRIPRLDVRPSQLTEQELLWFWDDDRPPAGRHASAAGPSAAGAAR